MRFVLNATRLVAASTAACSRPDMIVKVVDGGVETL